MPAPMSHSAPPFCDYATRRAELLQVAEHLNADGMGQATHADRLIATDASQVRDQIARGVVVRGGELHCPLRILPRG